MEHIGQEPVGNSDGHAILGQQIREIRLSKSMTLMQLAELAGTTAGHLSQIERGKSSASIDLLRRVSRSLGVEVAWFFHGSQGPSQEKERIVRRAHRRKLPYPDAGIVEELLSPNLRGSFELLLARISPGGGSTSEVREGYDAGILLNGQLSVTFDDERFVLLEGDAFTYRGECVVVHNHTDAEVELLWIVSLPRKVMRSRAPSEASFHPRHP